MSLLLSITTQMLWWAGPAQSQGFFQQLLGLSPSPQMHAAPRSIPPRPPNPGTRLRANLPADDAASERAARSTAQQGSGNYTTMCVRMCDGFYFPISHRVQRSRFHRDAEMCRTRCPGSEARLFYHSSSSDMTSAVDLTGRSYSRLPIAFGHRKKLVAGCGCRPEPWSVEAQVRHEMYAIAEGRNVPGGPRGIGSLTVVAGHYPDTPRRYETQTDEAVPVAGTPVAEADPTAAAAPVPAPASEPGAPSATTASGPSDDQQLLTTRGESRQRHSPPTDAQRVASTRHKSTAARAASRQAPPARPAGISPAARKPTQVASASPGGGKLVWPGDAPVRTR